MGLGFDTQHKKDSILTTLEEAESSLSGDGKDKSHIGNSLPSVESLSEKIDNSFVSDYIDTIENQNKSKEETSHQEEGFLGKAKSFFKSVGSFFSGVGSFFSGSKKESKEPEEKRGGWDILFSTTADMISNRRIEDGEKNIYKQKIKGKDSEDEQIASDYVDAKNLMRMDFSNSVSEEQDEASLGSGIKSFFGKTWFMTKLLILGQQQIEINDFKYNKYISLEKPTATVRRDKTVTVESKNVSVFSEFFTHGKHSVGKDATFKLDYDTGELLRKAQVDKAEFIGDIKGVHIKALPIHYIEQDIEFSAEQVELSKEVFGHDLTLGVDGFSIGINELKWKSAFIESDDIQISSIINITKPRFQVDKLDKGLKFNLSSKGFDILIKKNDSIDNDESSEEESRIKLGVSGDILVSKTKTDDNIENDKEISSWGVELASVNAEGNIYGLDFNLSGIDYNNGDNEFSMDSGVVGYNFGVEDEEKKITAKVTSLKINSDGINWNELAGTIPELKLTDYMKIRSTTFKVAGKSQKYAKTIETEDFELDLNDGDIKVNAGRLVGGKDSQGWHSQGHNIDAGITLNSLLLAVDKGYYDSRKKLFEAEDVSLTYNFDENTKLIGGVEGFKYKEKELDWEKAYGEVDELTFFDIITLGNARLEIEKDEDKYIKTISAEEFDFDAKKYGLNVSVEKVIATQQPDEDGKNKWSLKLEGANAEYEYNGLNINVDGLSVDYTDSLKLYADNATAHTQIYGADFSVAVDNLSFEDGKPDWDNITGKIENLNINDIISVEEATVTIQGKKDEYKKEVEANNFGISLNYNNIEALAMGNIKLEEDKDNWNITVSDANADARILNNRINLDNINYSSDEKKFTLDKAKISTNLWEKEILGEASNVVIDSKGLDWEEAKVGISTIGIGEFINIEEPLLTFKGREDNYRASLFTDKFSLNIPSLNIEADGKIEVEQNETGWATTVSNGNLKVDCNVFFANITNFNIDTDKSEIGAEIAEANISFINVNTTVNNVKLNKEEGFSFEKLSIKSGEDISIINDKIIISDLEAEVEKGEDGYTVNLGGSTTFGTTEDIFRGEAREGLISIGKGGIKSGSFESINISTNLFDFEVGNAEYKDKEMLIDNINFTIGSQSGLSDKEEDEYSSRLFDEGNNYYQFLGLFDGFGITLKEALINKEGFKVNKVELTKAKIPIDLGHVKGEFDIIGKSGELQLKEISIPKKENNTWFELDSPGIPIGGVPGLSVYAGVKLGGGISFSGNTGLKLKENRMFEATGGAAVAGEIVFDSHFGLKLGTDYLVSLAAEAFAEAKASANAGIDIKTLISFNNHSLKFDEDETRLQYNIGAGLCASIGARLKMSVLKIYNKVLYEVKFKEWEFAKVDIGGNVTWENGEITHKLDTKDINFIWSNKVEDATEEIDTTEGDNLRTKLLEAGKIYGSDNKEDPNSRYGITEKAEEMEGEFETYLELNKVKIEDSQKAMKRKKERSQGDIRKANEHIQKQKERLSKFSNLKEEMQAYRSGEASISRENLILLFSQKSFESIEGVGSEGSFEQLLMDYSLRKSQNKRGLFSRSSEDNSRDPEKQRKRYEALKKFKDEGVIDLTDETLRKIFSTNALNKGSRFMEKEDGPETLTEGVILHTKSRLDYYEGRLAIIDKIQQDFIDKINYYEKEISFAQAVLDDIQRALSNPKELLEEGDSDILNIIGSYSDEQLVKEKKQEFVNDVSNAIEMNKQGEETLNEIIADIEENFIDDTMEETLEEED